MGNLSSSLQDQVYFVSGSAAGGLEFYQEL